MDARSEKGLHLVRLERGEDVIATLTGYLSRCGLRSGVVLGIGAVRDVELGAYLLAEGRYATTRLEGDWELVSFQGTVSLVEGEPFIHPHVVVGNEAAEVRGGHLLAATIAVTGEFAILESGIPVSRRLDREVGLRLWNFDAPIPGGADDDDG